MDVRELTREYFDRKRAADAAQKEFDVYKKSFYSKVRGFMERTGKTSFSFGSDGMKLVVSDVRPKKVVFDAEALQKKLPLDVREAVIKKTCVINDWDGFAQYMKAVGASPSMVKSFIDVKKEVLVGELDNLVSEGKVSMEQLDGTYEVVVGDGYVKVTEVET